MNRIILAGMAFVACCAVTSTGHAQTEYHVSVQGDDHNGGTKSKPLKTISAAAALAQPGDVITVHAGVYRERVNPPRGGESDVKRIVYQAAPGETVEIKGSEVIKAWHQVQHDTWKVVIPNTFFGSFNPYSDLIRGDWFDAQGRNHHTGAVYLNGDALVEARKLDDVLKPSGASTLWFGLVGGDSTTIWAQFKHASPNAQLVEINVRRTVFYPETTGINYITVRGFAMRQAATPWAPPTAEQIGLIGTHWSKGWIIENNVISDSRNAGVALGKYGDQWDNKAGSAEGYVGTINRAIKNGWNEKTIGHHIVRNNVIANCGQVGIVGSLGAIFSTIADNDIHDMNVRELYFGAEVAGIKLHGAIDVTISHNHIHHNVIGIWLDWMAQGTQVEGNLLHDNAMRDVFIEVNHGPVLFDNNIFLSSVAVVDDSEGGAFTNNLMAGKVVGGEPDERKTPYFKPHSADLVDLVSVSGGDMRFYNNMFVEYDALRTYDAAKLPVFSAGNVLLKRQALKLNQEKDALYLEMTPEASWRIEPMRQVVTTAMLGRAKIPDQAFDNPDGSPVTINFDYFGKKRDGSNSSPGPFELHDDRRVVLKVWPR